MSKGKVLVTGGSGFIASYCILKLLEEGYEVRTTVRSLKREPEVRALLKSAGADTGERLSFVEADLMADAGWPEAVAGCDYVLHVASPFPIHVPKHEDDLIIPAREGALRVLRAARNAGVKRVVLTSSFAAVGYGHATTNKPFTEETWTDLTSPDISAYVKSKTIAERAAWDFIAREGGTLELATVNPVAVFGPVLGADHSTSIELVKKMMNRDMPGYPNVSFGVVDVRDVAALHLLAMTRPEAKGQRFLAIAGNFMTMQQMALILKSRLGKAADKVPTGKLPDWLVRAGSIFDPSVKQILPELGKTKNATSQKARTMLGWSPRSPEDAIAATGESLVKLGLLK